MVKKIILGLVLALMVFPVVIAIDTDINIKTLANHKVFVFVYPVEETKTYHQTFTGDSNSAGEIKFTHTGTEEAVDIRIKVTKDGKNILPGETKGTELFEGYSTGTPISIRFDYEIIDGDYSAHVAEVNETKEVNKTKEVENSTVVESAKEEVENKTVPEESKDSVTGSVISGDKGILSNIAFYIIGGILVVLVAVFFLARRFNISSFTMHKPQSSQPRNSDLPSIRNDSKELQKLEEQIKSAQRELKMIKNKERINQAEEKLKKDRDELERLKRGED